MKNNLFDNNKLNRLISKHGQELKPYKPEKNPVENWNRLLETGKLVNEKNNYVNFRTIILERLLGYELEDLGDFETNLGEGRPVEFVINKNNQPYVVIELKGCKTQLDERVSGRNAIQQATEYATVKKSTEWCLVSNFNAFRLFKPTNRENYISFHFNELKDSEILKKFLLTFSKYSLIENNITNELYDNTVVIQKQIKDFEDDFYNLFSETRLMLIKELQVTDEDIGKVGLSKEDSIHYAQLTLNRYIFLCFCEDKGLLPDITIKTLKNALEDGLYETELWSNLTKLFRYVNEGFPAKNISCYNGGLFSEKLKHLHIRDKVPTVFFDDCILKYDFKEKEDSAKELLSKYDYQYDSDTEIINPIFKNLIILSHFDFNTELDVNILGHIFENSIGDIEQLKGQNENQRKKEGVFYTPTYITDYICKNTIIPYLSKTGKAVTVDNLISEYNLGTSELKVLDDKLKNIKILDPACGSGAFLNKACDILLEIHEKLWNKLYKDNTSLDKYFDNNTVRRKILLDNIYGVDKNPESVEITKLGMFLKVARKGIELPTLDSNIRCGNSLISDSSFTEEAFNWKHEFKDIFIDGGFDIVIGNPPYVRQEKIKEYKPYFKDNYVTYTGVADLYVYFFEKGLNVLKEEGILTFICSNKFVKARYGEKLRELILKNQLKIYNDYTGVKVFNEASVDTCIIQIKKDFTENNTVYVNNEYEMKQNMLNKDSFMFNKPEILELRNKILNQGTIIKNLDIQINYGIKTGFNEAFIINEETRNMLINKDSKNKEIIKPLLRGRDIDKWQINYQQLYIIFTRRGIDINQYPIIKDFLSKYKEELTPKTKNSKKGDKGRKPGSYKWYEIQDNVAYYTSFEKEKIIYSEIVPEPRFVYDNKKFYTEATGFLMCSDSLNLKYMASLLNSKLLFWYFKDIGYNLGGKGFRYKKIFIEQIPIKFDEKLENIIVNDVDLILKASEKCTEEINNFKKWLTRTFELELSKKLESYYELTFEDFLNELEKKKVDTKPRDTQEFLEKEFNKSLSVIKPLKEQIEVTDKEINQLVYDLYGLTPEERKIIENNLKINKKRVIWI